MPYSHYNSLLLDSKSLEPTYLALAANTPKVTIVSLSGITKNAKMVDFLISDVRIITLGLEQNLWNRNG